MTLAAMLAESSPSLSDIAAFLDGADHDTRVAETRTLGRAQQRSLYELAAAAAPLTFDDFLPPDRAPLTPVRHHGTNTLPLPSAFRVFEKRFCRPAGDVAGLFGYNHGATEGIIGPGYFVTIPTAGNDAWEARGAIVVDYFQVPDGEVPAAWPKVKPNSSGLQRLVYYQTRDFMRRVSTHVTIGAAYKVEKPLGHFFTLVRQDG